MDSSLNEKAKGPNGQPLGPNTNGLPPNGNPKEVAPKPLTKLDLLKINPPKTFTEFLDRVSEKC